MLGLISNVSSSTISFIHKISIPLSPPLKKPSFSLQTIPKNFAIHSKNTDGDISGGEKRRSSTGLNIKWGDLLNPDPDNLFAVALSGLLAWASIQVLGQLVLISLAILVAALKYSFIAALLIFILITLL